MSIVNNEKMCGNCQFWDGDRKVSVYKTKAETTGNGMGVCICPQSPSKGCKEMAIAIKNCRCLTKWDELK